MLNLLIISKVWPLFRVISILLTNLQIDKKEKSVNVSSSPVRGHDLFYGINPDFEK